MATQPRVFLSYQRTDGDFARQVREHLVAAGVRAWMDAFDIPVGAYWPDAIDEALTSSDIVVGILSPDAGSSRYVSITFIDASNPDRAPAFAALLATFDGPARAVRCAAAAAPGEVLVSSTVKHLIAGSGFSFDEHAAAGVPLLAAEPRVYALTLA